MNLDQFIALAFKEDVGDGDHTSLACIPKDAHSRAKLLVKDNGVLAGVEIAKAIFNYFDPHLKIEQFLNDGDEIRVGDIAFYVSGSSRSILTTERLVLNTMQRMSGIATQSNKIQSLVGDSKTKILDTRKTTPLLRFLEKEAVKIGGAHNHRIGLYDMIMIKDNHIDFAGGISQAIERTKKYLAENNKDLKIEIEVRDFDELNEVLKIGGIDRIMLDNFTPTQIKEGLRLINGEYETEASGGITIETVGEYAKTNVDFISMGALTHSVQSLDLSLKAI
jgi:nicotinate-nucleotide pyrophosphorylase (carboxylating)